MLRGSYGCMLTTKLVPKLVRVQTAMACPLTDTGKISPIITQEMGPKLICTGRASCHSKSLLAIPRCWLLSSPPWLHDSHKLSASHVIIMCMQAEYSRCRLSA